MIEVMTDDTTNHIQIELHVPDFETVLEFYGKLGFKKVWHHSEKTNPHYLVMERQGTILNFWPGNDHVWEQGYFKKFPKDSVRGYGVEIFLPVDDIKSYYNEVKQFANVVAEINLRPWGLRDFRIVDPFGYYLRVTDRHDILDPNYAAIKSKELG
jgi:predicted enzyme related to lactoylglutathione lyase